MHSFFSPVSLIGKPCWLHLDDCKSWCQLTINHESFCDVNCRHQIEFNCWHQIDVAHWHKIISTKMFLFSNKIVIYHLVLPVVISDTHSWHRIDHLCWYQYHIWNLTSGRMSKSGLLTLRHAVDQMLTSIWGSRAHWADTCNQQNKTKYCTNFYM